MNQLATAQAFLDTCSARLRALRNPSRTLSVLRDWPSFAAYCPEAFDPASWPGEAARVWKTLALAVYAGGGCVFVPNNLCSLRGELPRFTEALLGVDAEGLGDVAIVRGYRLLSTPMSPMPVVPAAMSTDAIALVLSRAGSEPTPILVPLFDSDDAEALRLLSQKTRIVGDLHVTPRDGWLQPAGVRLWNVHHPTEHGAGTDGSARKFRDAIVDRLDRVLPTWFPAPSFGLRLKT